MNNPTTPIPSYPYNQYNLAEEIRKKIAVAIPGISDSIATKWVRLHFCVAYELALLGIVDFWIRPNQTGSAVEIWYKTKRAKGSKTLKAESMFIWQKLMGCVADAGIEIHIVKANRSIPPNGGGGGDDPITVMPT